ncbi:monothiol glutaredoxin-S1 [Ziziphus jujuba]|uniref:Monothiol glutaredoxin-S1 n=2 Tax=Ziziphus jujuba TaxID=326968 RepID=A0A6P4ARD0_ZIZJJ|nr:monothiol glutaredoxin-S1 [Ziziphus jujuba]KAH7517117.1 hypothetical protein FEM48_Zijuj09G0028300 [Ziziphus jujuba var. spinosa]
MASNTGAANRNNSNNIVGRLVEQKPLVIFSRSNCCMSHTMKTLIRSFGANPTVYELDEIRNGGEVERALQQMGCRPSVPAVFIGQEYVGGASEVMSLNLQNKLATLLIRAGAIWIWNGSD